MHDIRLVEAGAAGGVAADSALHEVKRDLGEVLVRQKMLVGGLVKILKRISERAEAERALSLCGEAQTVVLAVSNFKGADVCALAVLLRPHIAVLKFFNLHAVDSELSAGFSVAVGLVRTSAVPTDKVVFSGKPEL